MPIPAMKRHMSTPKPEVWNAMTAVVTEYQTSEKVNTVRLPYWSATCPRQIAPTNSPAKNANTKVPIPATCSGLSRLNGPSDSGVK